MSEQLTTEYLPPSRIEHGPYLPLDMDSLRNVNDELDVENSLEKALKDEGLELSDVAIQSLYQLARQRRTIVEYAVILQSMNKDKIPIYNAINREIEKIVILSEHYKLYDWLTGQIDDNIEIEDAYIDDQNYMPPTTQPAKPMVRSYREMFGQKLALTD
jgi:hypothetical protein